MEALKQNKTLLIILAVTLLGTGVYFMIPSSNTDIGLESDYGSTSADTKEVLDILRTLQGIKLNLSLFDSREFAGLLDYSISIPPVIPGRKDPFSPLAGLESVSESSSSR